MIGATLGYFFNMSEHQLAGLWAHFLIRGQARLSMFHKGIHQRDRLLDMGSVVGLVEILHSFSMDGEWGWKITAETAVTSWAISQSEITALQADTSALSMLWRLVALFVVFSNIGYANLD